MTQILKKALNKVNNLAERFMNSKFMKAWEQAAIERAQHYIEKNTIKELQALSDKELYDIGVNRGEIYDIAHRAHNNT